MYNSQDKQKTLKNIKNVLKEYFSNSPNKMHPSQIILLLDEKCLTYKINEESLSEIFKYAIYDSENKDQIIKEQFIDAYIDYIDSLLFRIKNNQDSINLLYEKEVQKDIGHIKLSSTTQLLLYLESIERKINEEIQEYQLRIYIDNQNVASTKQIKQNSPIQRLNEHYSFDIKKENNFLQFKIFSPEHSFEIASLTIELAELNYGYFKRDMFTEDHQQFTLNFKTKIQEQCKVIPEANERVINEKIQQLYNEKIKCEQKLIYLLQPIPEFSGKLELEDNKEEQKQIIIQKSPEAKTLTCEEQFVQMIDKKLNLKEHNHFAIFIFLMSITGVLSIIINFIHTEIDLIMIILVWILIKQNQYNEKISKFYLIFHFSYLLFDFFWIQFSNNNWINDSLIKYSIAYKYLFALLYILRIFYGLYLWRISIKIIPFLDLVKQSSFFNY